MSFFGTLRKVKKGKRPGEYNFQKTLQKVTEELEHRPSLALSNSTPNLHKINQGARPNSGSSIKTVPRFYLRSSSALNGSDEDDDNQSTGADSVETSTSSENPMRSQSPGPRKSSFAFSTGKLTSFVAKTTKATKVKKKPFKGSTPVLYAKHFHDIDENASLDSSWNSVEENADSQEDSRMPMRFTRRNSSGSVQINLKWREATRERIMKTPEDKKRDDLMVQGVKKFNRDSTRGMEFFLKNQLVGTSAKDHASFLRNSDNLSKTSVGTYLGEHHAFNQEVLAEFVKLHEFTNVHLVTSMRKFLGSFRLPGEAQKIDRIVEVFAKHYCSQNPTIFSNSDTCYLLAYALIMLNTTLHNPNVRDKPSVERFISMNRDIDDGKSLKPEFLASLYDSIKNEQFQIPEEDGNTELKLAFLNSDISGWLWKRGAKVKNWQRRWFVLNNNCLYYFLHQKDKVPRSIIPLESILATEGSKHGKYHVFILSKSSSTGSESIKSCKTLSDGTIVLGSHTEFVLGAESLQDRDDWLEAIQQNTSFDTYYTLLQEKKKKMADIQQRKILREKSTRHQHKNSIRKSQISMPISRPKTCHLSSDPGDSECGSIYNGDDISIMTRSASDSDDENSTEATDVFEYTAQAPSNSDSDELPNRISTDPPPMQEDRSPHPMICVSNVETADGRRNLPVIIHQSVDVADCPQEPKADISFAAGERAKFCDNNGVTSHKASTNIDPPTLGTEVEDAHLPSPTLAIKVEDDQLPPPTLEAEVEDVHLPLPILGDESKDDRLPSPILEAEVKDDHLPSPTLKPEEKDDRLTSIQSGPSSLETDQVLCVEQQLLVEASNADCVIPDQIVLQNDISPAAAIPMIKDDSSVESAPTSLKAELSVDTPQNLNEAQLADALTVECVIPEDNAIQEDVPTPTAKVMATLIKRDEISLRDHRLSSQGNETPTNNEITLDFAVTTTSSVC